MYYPVQQNCSFSNYLIEFIMYIINIIISILFNSSVCKKKYSSFNTNYTNYTNDIEMCIVAENDTIIQNKLNANKQD